jgi:hypothetical protein
MEKTVERPGDAGTVVLMEHNLGLYRKRLNALNLIIPAAV